MAIRTRLSPGTEIHEIDRSQYISKTDYSLVNTTSLVCGFADKGEDYTTQWINSKQTLVDAYGYPKTEFERYFYNAGLDILNSGGVLLMSKIPYENTAYGKFAYADYTISANCNIGSSKYYEQLRNLDKSIINYASIKSTATAQTNLIALEDLDQLMINTASLGKNKIRIVDITRANYAKTNMLSSNAIETQLISADYECLGIVPVIVSPINALLYQGMLSQTAEISSFQPVANVRRRSSAHTLDQELGISFANYEQNFEIPFNAQTIYDITISQIASKYFPSISLNDQNYVDRKYLKNIGVVVFKAYRDFANGNKTNFMPIESFVGSLDKTAMDENGKSLFIDTIVNSNSNYIKFFSTAILPTQTDIIAVDNQVAPIFGLYEQEVIKDISNAKILQALDIILKNNSDKNSIDIDLVVDAGITTIAQCVAKHQDLPTSERTTMIKKDAWLDDFTLNSKTDSSMWYAIANKFDVFCRTGRQDCMFIADGLRSFSLEGNQKIVRSTVLESSIVQSLIPKLKYQMRLNSSYSTGYIDWFQQVDDSSGNIFWCPPSIKAACAYIYTDAYFHPWNAPAGMTRGIVKSALDISFNPQDDEAGKIYTDNWNFAKSYPIDGIVLEGQKTFQASPSALDRVNVRRLLLSLEKSARYVSKFFKYENNTEYLRQRFVDMLVPYFNAAVDGNGISEYVILCDETNNTPEIIENNELHCQVAIRPIKCIEWIILNFICTNQSMSVQEEIRRTP